MTTIILVIKVALLIVIVNLVLTLLISRLLKKPFSSFLLQTVIGSSCHIFIVSVAALLLI